PDIVFVVDQAYSPYSVKDVLSVGDVVSRPNVVMLLSLTKQFVVPGLRIGYAVGNETVTSRIRSLRMPWSVNAMAIEASRYLLADGNGYDIDAESLHSEALRIAGEFRRIGISVEDTDCNFFLSSLPDRSASELKEWLIDKYGLLIRDASNFEGLSKRHFRIAAQSAEENDLLIKAIEEWISL
ncbi:MAG: aminotransferase class I/II-fold pyridoxal phosphate-dependent enzyme, partial [Muribaculaceae bacterium]|nr:aminotransferase class I/II-fold pyridoxal phosphate-dependent enzyme [Muribaculaceae bacterium]